MLSSSILDAWSGKAGAADINDADANILVQHQSHRGKP